MKAHLFFQPIAPSPATIAMTPIVNDAYAPSNFITAEIDPHQLLEIMSGKLRERLLRSAPSKTKNIIDYKEILEILINFIYIETYSDDALEIPCPSDITNENTYILMFFCLEHYIDSMGYALTRSNAATLLISSFSFANKWLNDDKFTDKELLFTIKEQLEELYSEIQKEPKKWSSQLQEELKEFSPQLQEETEEWSSEIEEEETEEQLPEDYKKLLQDINTFQRRLLSDNFTFFSQKETFETYKNHFLTYESPYSSSVTILNLHP